MNSPPMSVTAHSGILSKKPQLLHGGDDLLGKTVCCAVTKACRIHNGRNNALDDIEQGQHQLHAIGDGAFGKANRINSFRCVFRLLTSAKEPQVFITPTTKNSTSSARPMACNAPWIFTITPQIVPPLKCCGLWVMSCQISDSFSFQVSKFWHFQDFVRPSYHSPCFFLLSARQDGFPPCRILFFSPWITALAVIRSEFPWQR